MRKSVTFRFDSDLLELARQHANADHRSLTNFVETAVLRVLTTDKDLIRISAGSAKAHSAVTETIATGAVEEGDQEGVDERG
jgi:tetraacyldisaccharide-1-P 4'-kinase